MTLNTCWHKRMNSGMHYFYVLKLMVPVIYVADQIIF